MDNELLVLAKDLGERLKAGNLKLALAESCTGGMAAQYMTAIAGSSAWFDCGFVTYSNLSKQHMLGVPAKTLAEYGAVSKQTATAMANGALKNSHADIAASITGIAGPDGGTLGKPVGTVCFAWSGKNFKTITSTESFKGDRQKIRQQSVQHLMANLIKMLA